MGKLISIHSFRGGTGKSNIAANMSTFIASLDNRIGVIDTDIQSPGIHTLFKFGLNGEQKGLNNYLREECLIGDIIYDVTKNIGISKGLVHLIPSSMSTNEIARLLADGYDATRLNKGLQDLMRELKLDYLFVDSHPGINEETLLSISLSDILCVVMRPDSQDYQGTAVIVEVAKRLNVPKICIIVNKVLTVMNTEEIKKNVEDTYEVEVIGLLPLSEDVAYTGSSDVFIIKNPEDLFTNAIKEITLKLISIIKTKEN